MNGRFFESAIILLITLILLLPKWIDPREYNNLDPGIPRVETPASKIAYVRTKWINDLHLETDYLDAQYRVLEVFEFGRNCYKRLQLYEGDKNTVTIRYTHTDSSPRGEVWVDTLRRIFDARGRVVMDSQRFGTIYSYEDSIFRGGYITRHLDYAANGDTIIKRIESESPLPGVTVVDTDHWEKDRKERLRHHYRLYIAKFPNRSTVDTLEYISERFAYDASGKLAFAWKDNYSDLNGRWYRYDKQGRLIEVRVPRSGLAPIIKKVNPPADASPYEKEEWYKKNYFVADSTLNKNPDYYSFRYQYEVFHPQKHLPLRIPTTDRHWWSEAQRKPK